MRYLLSGIAFLFLFVCSPVFGQVIGEKMLNDMVRAQLAQAGDDGSVPRLVTHFAYPVASAKSNSRRSIKKYLEGLGYSVENTTRRGVVFEKTQAISPGPFDELTQSLQQTLLQAGWEYDGWETFLVTK